MLGNYCVDHERLAWDRFWAAKGEPYCWLGCDQIINLRNQDRENFKRYNHSGNVADLFPHIDQKVVSTIKIGKNLAIAFQSRMEFESGVSIGENCNVMANGTIIIGEGAKVGDNVNLVTASHPSNPDMRCGPWISKASPLCIGRNVTIGDGSIILSTGKGVVRVPDNTNLPKNSLVYRSVNGLNYIIMDRSPLSKNLIDNNYLLFYRVLHMRPPCYINATEKNLFFDVPYNRLNYSNIFINRCAKIIVPNSSGARIGNGFMMARDSEIILGNNSQLIIENNVWMCVASTIYVPDNASLRIGSGVIVAPNAVLTQSIAKNNMFLGKGRIKSIDSEQHFMPQLWLEPDFIRSRLNLNTI